LNETSLPGETRCRGVDTAPCSGKLDRATWGSELETVNQTTVQKGIPSEDLRGIISWKSRKGEPRRKRVWKRFSVSNPFGNVDKESLKGIGKRREKGGGTDQTSEKGRGGGWVPDRWNKGGKIP